MEWKPIETSPKDCKEILCCFIGQFDRCVYFVGMDMPYGVVCHGYAQPTHWMPLPAPPSKAKGE